MIKLSYICGVVMSVLYRVTTPIVILAIRSQHVSCAGWGRHSGTKGCICIIGGAYSSLCGEDRFVRNAREEAQAG